MRVGNKDLRRGGPGWGTILSIVDVAQGYADHWTGAPWPKDVDWYYERGRLFAAELHGLGQAAPPTIKPMRRITKEWKQRIYRCHSFCWMFGIRHVPIPIKERLVH